MVELLTDRRDFRKAVLIVALGFSVWSLAVSVDWGWIPASFVVLALVVDLTTGRLADPVLLTAVTVPTVVSESQDKGNVGWFVVVLVLAVVASADEVRAITRVLIVATVLAPLALWAARVDDYVELGPWTWFAGLALGWVFGVVIGHLTRAIGELEESRALLADSAARDERQRVAREIHDLVGHSFSVVLLHLSGARTTLATDPDRAAAALADAEAVGRKGMDDLREALALMRAEEGRRRPVVSLDGLDPLVEEYRRAGLDVRIRRAGAVERVATGVGIVAYEVVREALTNAAKHAPESVIDVRLEVGPETLDVTIANDRDEDATAVGRGSGIEGMCHRVRSLDGSFDAGPIDGRWQVAARIPLGASTASDQPEVRA